MRKSEPTRHATIEPAYTGRLIGVLQKAGVKLEDFGLFLLIADMLDNLYLGRDLYMVLGATQKRDSYSVSIKGADGTDPVYDATFKGLNHKCYALVDPPEINQ